MRSEGLWAGERWCDEREAMSQTRRHEYYRSINKEGNVIRIEFTTQGREVTQFTVQFEILIDGAWTPVVRFDTAHGGPHRDILGRHGEVIRQDFGWFPREPPYNAALTAAQQELDESWATYRSAFLGRTL